MLVELYINRIGPYDEERGAVLAIGQAGIDHLQLPFKGGRQVSKRFDNKSPVKKIIPPQGDYEIKGQPLLGIADGHAIKEWANKFLFKKFFSLDGEKKKKHTKEELDAIYSNLMDQWRASLEAYHGTYGAGYTPRYTTSGNSIGFALHSNAVRAPDRLLIDVRRKYGDAIWSKFKELILQ